jgi:hypothetical protein
MSFASEWFHDIPAVMAKTDALFASWVAEGKAVSRNDTTKKKIYESRKWIRRLVEPNFDAVLNRLQVFYLPKALRPGPAFVFPLRDLDGRYNQAQVRPFPDSYLFLPDSKYRRLGTTQSFKGPQWFGNDLMTIQKIIETQRVCLVEGAFDELACKLLVPDAPVLTSLTKGIGEDHIEYLRILGVNRIVTLFDNEAKGQGSKGAAVTKQRVEDKFASGIEVSSAQCSAHDPSDALKSEPLAVALELFLKSL